MSLSCAATAAESLAVISVALTLVGFWVVEMQTDEEFMQSYMYCGIDKVWLKASYTSGLRPHTLVASGTKSSCRPICIVSSTRCVCVRACVRAVCVCVCVRARVYRRDADSIVASVRCVSVCVYRERERERERCRRTKSSCGAICGVCVCVCVCLYVHVNVYVCMYVCMYIYMYIYANGRRFMQSYMYCGIGKVCVCVCIQRERERERERDADGRRVHAELRIVASRCVCVCVCSAMQRHTVTLHTHKLHAHVCAELHGTCIVARERYIYTERQRKTERECVYI